MGIFKQLFQVHVHHWGIPHTRTVDNRLVQTCYECSQDRELRIELRESTNCNNAKSLTEGI